MLFTYLYGLLSEHILLVVLKLKEEFQFHGIHRMEFAEEMSSITVLILCDEAAYLLRNIFAVRAFEEDIDLLRVTAIEHTLVCHIELLSGIAAESPPEQHYTDIALMQHVVIFVLFALARHGSIKILPFLKVEFNTAPLEQFIQMQHEVSHLLPLRREFL